MPVVVDRQPLEVEPLGLRTIGQLLSHLQKDNRLVVHVLVDGQEPDLQRMGAVRRTPLDQHTLFIETADPRQIAADALAQVCEQLNEGDRLRLEAAALLQRQQHVKAMELLRGCFSIWQCAQESLLKTAQLLRIDPASIHIGDLLLPQLLLQFTNRLRTIKSALEIRDFPRVADILSREMTQTRSQWLTALNGLRQSIN